MSDSLKDQLLKLGFKSAPRKEAASRKPKKPRPGADIAQKSAQRRKKTSSEEFDLAKAYAIRAKAEKEERIAAEKQRQEEARVRRENRAKLGELLNRVRLNDDAAEIARHFEYGGKIRRIHVTENQLKALNAGELCVVQLAGRYHLVSLADGDEAERIMPGSLALRVDPNAPPESEDYSDPKYQVPDDLVW